MEIILLIIGLVIIGAILFVMTGLFGWCIHLLGYVIEFLSVGTSNCIGCFLQIFVGFIVISVLIGLLL